MSTFDPSVVLQSRSWIDRAADVIAPAWGLRRMEAKVQRALFDYNAARANRIYNPKTTGQPAESSQTERDRTVMMWEARDLIENFPVAREVPRKFANYLTVTEYSPTTGDKGYNREVTSFFHEWCKACDVTGRHSFKKLMQLAVEHRTVDGDCGFAIRRTRDGLRLQLVPGTLIGDPQMSGVNSENYHQGVIVDQYGKPTAYRVFKVTPSGIYFDPEDIGAKNFVHYFDPFRVDQYRGVTDFHAAIRTARMLYEILEAEKVGVRFATQQAALVFSDRGTALSKNLFTPTPSTTMANGQVQQNELTDVGMIRYLGAGDKVEVMPGRPSSAFAGFVDHLMQEIALGVGVPYGVLFGTGGYHGPNVRAEFAAADRVFTKAQGVLIDKVLDPIKNAVLLDAIAEGMLDAPPKEKGEETIDALKRATAGEWRFPARLSIDVGRESAANMAENRQGAKSLQEIAAEEGTDAFTRLDQIAAEAAYIHELAEKYEIPETAIRLVTQQLPTTPIAAMASGAGLGEAAAAVAPAGAGAKADGAAIATDQIPAVAEAITPLNGAQITAVLAVCDAIRAGDMAAEAGASLMISAGMTPESARKVAASVAALPKKEPEPAAPRVPAEFARLIEKARASKETPKDRIAFALRGPSALKLARSEAMVNKQERLAAMRKRLGNQNADAEITRSVFSRAIGVKFEKPAPGPTAEEIAADKKKLDDAQRQAARVEFSQRITAKLSGKSSIKNSP